jgi:hypothetical protein
MGGQSSVHADNSAFGTFRTWKCSDLSPQGEPKLTISARVRPLVFVRLLGPWTKCVVYAQSFMLLVPSNHATLALLLIADRAAAAADERG